ncbi:MAG TPA: cell division protein FtsA, partial [bacterium]|nr:cell division protein FtsA [bacterium]
AMMNNEDYLVGIDIGSEKISVLMVDVTSPRLPVLGFAAVPTRGMRQGAVTSLGDLGAAIERAVLEVEEASGKAIEKVHLSLNGEHFRPVVRQGEVEIRNRQDEVFESDRQAVLSRALPVPLSEGEVLHCIVQEFLLDDQRGIDNPVGMYGRNLKANIYLITAAVNNLKNIRRCLADFKLEAASVGYAPLLAAGAVLTPEELAEGVAYLDFGKTTTTLLIFKSTLREVGVVHRGGDRLNFALRYCLNTTPAEAERLKRNYGSCLADGLDVQEEIMVSNAQGEVRQTTSRGFIAEVINAELKDMFSPLQSFFIKNRPVIPAGLVLGGGGAQLPGLVDFMEKDLKLPARVGMPDGFDGWEKVIKSPAYNSLLGVVKTNLPGTQGREEGGGRRSGVTRVLTRHFRKITDILKDNF